MSVGQVKQDLKVRLQIFCVLFCLIFSFISSGVSAAQNDKTSTDIYCESMTLAVIESYQSPKTPESERRVEKVRSEMLATCKAMPTTGSSEKNVKNMTPQEISLLSCIGTAEGLVTAQSDFSTNHFSYAELANNRKLIADACAKNKEKFLGDLRKKGLKQAVGLGASKNDIASKGDKTSKDLYCESMSLALYESLLNYQASKITGFENRVEKSQAETFKGCKALPTIGVPEKSIKDMTPQEASLISCIGIAEGTFMAQADSTSNYFSYTDLTKHRKFIASACVTSKKRFLGDLKEHGPKYVLTQNYQ